MRNRALITRTLNLSHRLVFFAGIGGVSALVHILTVLYLVTYFELPPLLANILAFFLAFNVSFIGHKYLTFARLNDEKQLSLPHFFIVASSAGILNEFLYFLFLTYTGLNYLNALILVLGLVSIYTFFLSRFWACR
jgi:putative flippase GtrA